MIGDSLLTGISAIAAHAGMAGVVDTVDLWLACSCPRYSTQRDDFGDAKRQLNLCIMKICASWIAAIHRCQLVTAPAFHPCLGLFLHVFFATEATESLIYLIVFAFVDGFRMAYARVRRSMFSTITILTRAKKEYRAHRHKRRNLPSSCQRLFPVFFLHTCRAER